MPPLETAPAWGGPGVHGIPRSRRWDEVAVVAAQGPPGAEVARFVLLAGGGHVAEEQGAPDVRGRRAGAPGGARAAGGAPGVRGAGAAPAASAAGLDELVSAARRELVAPCRVEAVRRGPRLWACAASAIATATLPPGTPGDHIVLAVRDGRRLLRVDDMPDFTSLPSVEALAAGLGPDFVVQAHRLAENVWEVRAEPL